MDAFIDIPTAPAVVASILTALSYVTINTDEDGTGAYGDTDFFEAELLSWTPAGGAVVQLTNHTSVDWYVANNAGIPPLSLKGWIAIDSAAVHVTRDEPSIATRRGERSMDASPPFIYSQHDAARFGRRITSQYGRPQAIIESLRIFGDPRLQPGDLVTLADTENTQLSGFWRLMEIVHEISGPKYVQTVKLRKIDAFPGVYGTAIYGQAIYADADLYP
jgi:hypothetical protein